jgi:hypothetical protein
MAKDPRSAKERDPGADAYYAWTDPDKDKKVESKKEKKVVAEKVVTKKAVVKNSAVFTADDYTRTVSSGSEQVSGHDESGGDYLDYVLTNPDLRENAEALGLTQSEMNEWGEAHWNEWGSRTIESRVNTPFALANPAARYAEWEMGENVPIVYAGQTIEQVLENSIRAQYKGADVDDYQMWESREQIADAWNQGQFTGQGWNMLADQPYGTGILGNTIAVNEDIGQLIPTTGGNQRFIQDRYVDASLAKDFPVSWVTNNKWTGPENLGAYWDALTSATRDASGNLVRATPYDPTTALGPSVSVGPRGAPTVGGGLLGNMYEAAYQPRGLLDWEKYQTDPDFVLQENKLANYQPWAEGIGDAGALPSYATLESIKPYYSGGSGATTSGAYDPVINTKTSTSTNTGNTVTDAQGKTWIMSNGQWIPTTSDLGSILSAGDTSRYPLGHYDSNGMWVGAEGVPGGHLGSIARQIGPAGMLSFDLDTGLIGTGTATQGGYKPGGLPSGGINFTPAG